MRAKQLYFNEAVKPLSEIASTAYKADIYVFCVQHHRDHETFSVLNLSQWSFNVLTKPELEAAAKGSAAVSLAAIELPGYAAADYQGLGDAINSACTRASHLQASHEDG